MATKEDFQLGDVLATHGDKWLSKGIQLMMKLYCKGLGKKYKVMFNHNVTIINVWGELWVAEALGWGPRIYSLEQSGYIDMKDFIILRDKRGFTDDQIKAMSEKMISMGGVRYQYEAFFQWIGKIVFKRKTFHATGENEVNCSELAAIFINTAYPDTFPRPNEVSPMDHVFADNYETTDVNGIL